MPAVNFRLALVTGATSGLGNALCDLLSRRGIPLFLTGRDETLLKAAEVRYNAGSLSLDLNYNRDPLLHWIEEHQPDLVINNAGLALYGPVLMHPTESQMEILEVNGAAAIEISIEAARSLLAHKKKGIILNVSSSAGQFSTPTMAVYAASKSLLTSFSKSFDAEVRSSGIRILASLPGPIATSFAERASGGLFKQRPSWHVMSPKQAAQKIWQQIEKQKGVRVIDFRTRAALAITRFLPSILVKKILQKKISQRYTHCP